MEENLNIDNSATLGFEMPGRKAPIIKVIGVGGGGGNAVNHMYNEGIHDVSFVVCNTDNQALDSSPVPHRLQLGSEGLGAGNRPQRAREAAEESIESIRAMLSDGTKMVFVTAGMGGGTGTGAAPVIAREAKNMGILTVGIVTIPFRFEGNRKIDQALDGLEEMQKHVDALLVINNERLREIHHDLTLLDAFAKADDTLSIAAKSIAEIITLRGTMNLDFQDVKTVLRDGGVAIMSTAYGEGDGRISKAIDEALNSPLVNHSDVYKSKKILVNIVFSKQHEGEALMMEEMNEVHEFMSRFDPNVETKFGVGTDETLGKKVKITILATGFGLSDVLTDVGNEKAQQDIIDEEAEEHRRQRRSQFYHDEDAAKQHRFQFYRFRPADLDHDDVISMVENSPTYNREHTLLNKIRSLNPEAATRREAEVMPADTNDNVQTIVF